MARTAAYLFVVLGTLAIVTALAAATLHVELNRYEFGVNSTIGCVASGTISPYRDGGC